MNLGEKAVNKLLAVDSKRVMFFAWRRIWIQDACG
jgi:hypothetical protein